MLHLPGEDKKDDFKKALDEKLGNQDFHFSGAFFPSGTAQFKNRKFVSADFSNATFSGVTDFSEAQFSGEETSFREAQFSGEWTDFRGAQFRSSKETSFGGAQFGGEGTDFRGAQFNGERTDFVEAQFSSSWWTDFGGAQFRSSEWTSFYRAKFRSSGWTSFGGAHFTSKDTAFEEVSFTGEEVLFHRATFQEKVAFLGTKENDAFSSCSLVKFEHCRIDKPELLTFNTVTLRPSWFINTDVRMVDFTDVKWYRLPDEPKTLEHSLQSLEGRVKGAIEAFKRSNKAEEDSKLLQESEVESAVSTEGPRLAQAWQQLTTTALDDEIKELRKREVSSPYTLLSQACQRLAANAEENRNHGHASGFNYWAMDAKRREKRASAFAPWRLLWWYWALSGYGERTWRSAIWLVGFLVGFAILYLLVGHVQGLPSALSHVQSFPDAVAYSLGVMSRQADKLPSDASTLLRYLVFIEGILGPLQVALFALALRRRFMRGKG